MYIRWQLYSSGGITTTIHICMHAHDMYTYVCMTVCIYAYMYAYICMNVYKHVYVCIHTHVCMHAYTYCDWSLGMY